MKTEMIGHTFCVGIQLNKDFSQQLNPQVNERPRPMTVLKIAVAADTSKQVFGRLFQKQLGQNKDASSDQQPPKGTRDKAKLQGVRTLLP